MDDTSGLHVNAGKQMAREWVQPPRGSGERERGGGTALR